jgi:L-alanine-DL-glutamate epimerase-like enolase superfamily enzyme
MKIDEIRIFPCKLERKRAFVTSRGAQTFVDVIFTKIFAGKNYGWGASLPRGHLKNPLTHQGETLDSSLSFIQRVSDKLIGLEIEEYPSFLRKMKESSLKHPNSFCGIDEAIYDLISRYKKIPGWRLFSEKPRRKAWRYAGFINADEIEVKKIAKKQSLLGFDPIRIKCGYLSLEEDVERVKEVAKFARVWVDANEAWSREDTLNLVEKISFKEPLIIEQPLPSEDIDGMREIKGGASSNVFLLADEAVWSSDGIKKLAFLDGITIKLVKSGSISELEQLAKRAKEYGVRCYLGGTTSTNFSAWVNRNLEASLPNLGLFEIESIAYGFSAGKFRGALEGKFFRKRKYSSYGRPPLEVGLGIDLDEKKLKRISLERIVVG